MNREPIKQITFRELYPTDSILIETQNSAYTFLVLDPVSGQGILSGGVLGEASDAAVLLGATVEGNIWKLDPTCLRVDAGALFLLNSRDGLKRLATSKITRIFCAKGYREQKLIA